MKGISRRTLIGAAGLSVVFAGIRAGFVTAGHAIRRRLVVGSLTDIGDPHTVTVQTGSGAETVKFLGDGSEHARATFNRDGEAALSDFRAGDEVVVELRDTGTPARGSRMELLYRWFYGYVTGLGDDHLYTTGGTVRLDSRTTVHILGDFFTKVPLTDLTPGTHVDVTARWEPAIKEYLARSVGVESQG